jgi:hypothetical protein
VLGDREPAAQSADVGELAQALWLLLLALYAALNSKAGE